jgi:hypothetical protein
MNNSGASPGQQQCSKVKSNERVLCGSRLKGAAAPAKIQNADGLVLYLTVSLFLYSVPQIKFIKCVFVFSFYLDDSNR